MSAATILLVDDDEVLSQVLRRVLERVGYRVLTAGSVAQALQLARDERPDLGLLDLRLPDGDGVELARRLEEQLGHIPLLLMTAYPLRLRDHPELAKGFAQVLTKPLNIDELRHVIETTLAPDQGRPRPAAVVPPADAPSPVHDPEAAKAFRAPAAPAPDTAQTAPARHRKTRWVVLGGAAVAVAALLVALPALGMPSLEALFRRSTGGPGAEEATGSARLLPGKVPGLELDREVVDRLGVTATQVRPTAAPIPLELAGSLAFNPNKLFRVQARFPGEVVSITHIDEPGAGEGGITQRRELRYGDRVSRGQVMAVVLSNTLGEKKSELVTALVQLQFDEETLRNYEKIEGSVLPEVKLRDQRNTVRKERTAAAAIELSLKTWGIPQSMIDELKEEAEAVGRRGGKRNLDKETEWAKVEVKAPFDGVIVEKNVALHNIVDPSFDLFKVADLSQLGVMVHAYEEDLRALRKLPRGYPWEVRAGADPRGRVLKSNGMQQLGLVIDPNQHTDPVMGLVDNPDGELRVGQFVTATIDLPPPKRVTAVPVSALDETGGASFVFVQPDPDAPRYVLRRVLVVQRLHHFAYVRTPLDPEEKERGLEEVRPGDWVVTSGVVELRAALEELRAKARK